MISKAVQEGINRQICVELVAAYSYLAMVAHFEQKNLTGMASWMRLQAQEEIGHAMRLFDHVLMRGGSVSLEAVDKPKSAFSSPLEVFEFALSHEQRVTSEINELYELAVQEKDYPTQVELQWFITEQVEEEQSTGEVVDRLRMVGDDATGLLMMDTQLGARKLGEEE